MRRFVARSSGPAPSMHTRSLARFITTMCGFRFSAHTPFLAPLVRCTIHLIFVSHQGDICSEPPVGVFLSFRRTMKTRTNLRAAVLILAGVAALVVAVQFFHAGPLSSLPF